MTLPAATPPPGDQARVSVTVNVPVEEAFRVFTQEIDLWWKRGVRYRVAGSKRGIICMEPHVGGRLMESFDTHAGPKVIVTGQVTAWEPPHRLVFEWRAANFAPEEKTEVEVSFAPHNTGTVATVTHRGWSRIRPDHPARHGCETAAFLRMKGMWWGDLMTSWRAQLQHDRGE